MIPNFLCPVCGRDKLKAYSMSTANMITNGDQHNPRITTTWLCGGCTTAVTLEYRPDLVEASLYKAEPTVVR